MKRTFAFIIKDGEESSPSERRRAKYLRYTGHVERIFRRATVEEIADRAGLQTIHE